MEFYKINNRSVDGPFAKQGFINLPLAQMLKVGTNALAGSPVLEAPVFHPIPLESVRETDGSQDVAAIHDTPLTADPDGFGGLLAKNTTPILEYTNVDTDSALRLNWATSNVEPVFFNLSLPSNLDVTRDISIYVRGSCADDNAIDVDTFFNEGDSKVSDATNVLDAVVANVVATVAAADVPAGARTMSVELTPATHGGAAMYVYGIWVEYYVGTVGTGPDLTYTNGDTDSSFMLRWDASESTPIAFQTVLPPDFDVNDPLYVEAYGLMDSDTDTPTLALDSYFNIGDTKVSDATEALSDSAAVVTATIAAADIPADAVTFTCEITPGAHTTDILDLYGVWLRYTKL